MNERQQMTLVSIIKNNAVAWSPDESTCRFITSITHRTDEDELCANFSDGKYVALGNCNPEDFLIVEQLTDYL